MQTRGDIVTIEDIRPIALDTHRLPMGRAMFDAVDTVVYGTAYSSISALIELVTSDTRDAVLDAVREAIS